MAWLQILKSESIILSEYGKYPEILCKTPRGLFIKELSQDSIVYLDFDLKVSKF